MDSGPGSRLSVSDANSNDLSSDPDATITSGEFPSSNLSIDPAHHFNSGAIDFGATIVAAYGSLDDWR